MGWSEHKKGTYSNPKTGDVSTLYYNEETKNGIVERVVWCKTHQQVVHTGIWVEGGELVDYDGVYILHEDTAKVLRANGIRVPKSEFTTIR